MTALTISRPLSTPSNPTNRLQVKSPPRPSQPPTTTNAVPPQSQFLAIILVGASSAEQDAIAQEIARQGFRVQRDEHSAASERITPQPIDRVRDVLQRRLGFTAFTVLSVGHPAWTTPPVEPVLQFERLSIDRARHEVRVDGELAPLSKTEFNLLHLLASQPEQVCTRRQIVAASHGDAFPVTSRSVDVHVAAVRRKLGPVGGVIQTVRGVGYRFVAAQPRIADTA